MPPHYLLRELAEEHLHDLRKLNEPFVTPAWVLSLRNLLSVVLIRTGTALAKHDHPTRVGISPANTPTP